MLRIIGQNRECLDQVEKKPNSVTPLVVQAGFMAHMTIENDDGQEKNLKFLQVLLSLYCGFFTPNLKKV